MADLLDLQIVPKTTVLETECPFETNFIGFVSDYKITASAIRAVRMC
jgi:hypothetical protein